MKSRTHSSRRLKRSVDAIFNIPGHFHRLYALYGVSSTSAKGGSTTRIRAVKMPAKEKLDRLALGGGAAGASLKATPGDAGVAEQFPRGHVAPGAWVLYREHTVP